MNLRDSIRELTGLDQLEQDGSVFFSVFANVRQRAVNELGEPDDLHYHCEPMNSPDYNGNLTPFSLDEEGVQVRNVAATVITKDKSVIGMTDDELKLSQASWIYDVKLASITNKEEGSTSENAEGIFSLPTLGSLVIISYLNATDAFISLLSESSELKIKSGQQQFIMKIQKFLEINKALSEFSKSDIFRIFTNTPDVELFIEDLILLKNGENEISVEKEDITIRAFNANADINLRSNGSIITTSTATSGYAGSPTAGTGIINVRDRFQIKNNISNLKTLFLQEGVDSFFDELVTVLNNINTQLGLANGIGAGSTSVSGTATAVSLSNLTDAQDAYGDTVDKLLF